MFGQPVGDQFNDEWKEKKRALGRGNLRAVLIAITLLRRPRSGIYVIAR